MKIEKVDITVISISIFIISVLLFWLFNELIIIGVNPTLLMILLPLGTLISSVLVFFLIWGIVSEGKFDN